MEFIGVTEFMEIVLKAFIVALGFYEDMGSRGWRVRPQMESECGVRHGVRRCCCCDHRGWFVGGGRWNAYCE